MSSSSPTPITCHVLNTLSGTPAADLKATLTLLPSPKRTTTGPPTSWSALTNSDGRVKDWTPSGEQQQTLQALLENYSQGERVAFSIKFEVGEWYEGQGIESFWPEVEVKFWVKKGERHYHVPVLVGPWTYTSYRGS